MAQEQSGGIWSGVAPRWILAGLVLVAILVRVAYVWGLPADRLKWGDEQEFDDIAWRLAQTGRYESFPYRATPVLPWFLAAVYRVAGHNYRVARVAQAVSGGVIVLAMYGIGASLFARRTGYVAAVGVAFYPPLIYLCGVFYAEHLFTVLLTATVLCLVKWWQTKRYLWLVAAGLGLGLGALCRPVFMVFVPLAAVYVGWTAVARRQWQSVAVMVGVMAMTIAPWTVRNAFTFHHFVPISTGLGIHLWRGNNDTSRGDADDRTLLPGGAFWVQRVRELPDPAERQAAWAREKEFEAAVMARAVLGNGPLDFSSTKTTAARLDWVECDRLLERAGERWMVYHPDAVLRLSARRLLELYSAFTRTRTQNEDTNRRNRIIAAISFYPVLALGLIGAVVAWHMQRASVVLHAAIVAGMAVYLLTTACTRFRLPLDPFWILLASVVVTSGWERIRVAVISAWDSAWERPESPSPAQGR
jgi:4-amino-4-deoxy-L-arabinose transferase-like glycosyltransferase